MFIYQFTRLVTIFVIFRPNRPDYKQRFSSIFFFRLENVSPILAVNFVLTEQKLSIYLSQLL